MPIILIWNAAASPRERQFLRWVAELNVAGAAIGKWLGKRLKEADEIERETRGFPVVLFYNLALTVRVAPLQAGAILSGDEPGILDSFREIGRAWRIDRVWTNRVRETELLPGLARALADMTQSVLASIDRFRTPTAAMFNPEGARASDLFGIGALAFRALGQGRLTILQSLGRVEAALNPPKPEAAAAGAAVGAAAGAIAGPAAGSMAAAAARAAVSARSAEAAAAPLPLYMRLDEGLRYIAGAVLILPAIGAMAIQLAQDVMLWIRHTVIEFAFGLEQDIFDLRQTILTGLRDGLTTFSTVSAQFLVIARDYALGHIRHWARFSAVYMRGLVNGISGFATQFQTFWSHVMTLVNTIIAWSQRLMGVDVGGVVHHFLRVLSRTIAFLDFHFYAIGDSPQSYSAPRQFPVTLGGLVLNEGGGVRARRELETAFSRVVAAMRGASGLNFNLALFSRLGDINLFQALNGLNGLIQRLGTRPRALRGQPLLRYSQETEPDLARQVIEPMRTALHRNVRDISNAAQQAAENSVVAITQMFDGVATAFSAAALQAVRLGSMRTYDRIMQGSEAFVRDTFPNERRSQPTGLEAIGRAFGTWMQGAFEGLGAIAAGWLGFILGEWTQHLDANADTPVQVFETSPAILLERARLTRVHMPEMRVVAGAQTTNADLARRIAQRFRVAVQDAHRDGEDRLGAWRSAAAAAAQ